MSPLVAILGGRHDREVSLTAQEGVCKIPIKLAYVLFSESGSAILVEVFQRKPERSQDGMCGFFRPRGVVRILNR